MNLGQDSFHAQDHDIVDRPSTAAHFLLEHAADFPIEVATVKVADVSIGAALVEIWVHMLDVLKPCENVFQTRRSLRRDRARKIRRAESRSSGLGRRGWKQKGDAQGIGLTSQ